MHTGWWKSTREERRRSSPHDLGHYLVCRATGEAPRAKLVVCPSNREAPEHGTTVAVRWSRRHPSFAEKCKHLKCCTKAMRRIP